MIGEDGVELAFSELRGGDEVGVVEGFKKFLHRLPSPLRDGVEERLWGARRALRGSERILLEDAITAETALAFALSLLGRLGLDAPNDLGDPLAILLVGEVGPARELRELESLLEETETRIELLAAALLATLEGAISPDSPDRLAARDVMGGVDSGEG